MPPTVGQEVEAIGLDLSWLFSEAVKLFLLACKTLVDELKTLGPTEIQIIKDSVADGVAAAETQGGTSLQKLEYAGGVIVKDLISKNITVSLSLINAMCSALVAQWNKDGGWPAKL